MKENDVFIPENKMADFLLQFDEEPANFLFSYYKLADNSWYWKMVFNTNNQVYSCFLQVTRNTGAIIPILMQQRIIEGGITNDEAFLATMITTLGTVRDFSDFSNNIYDDHAFYYQVPKWRGAISSLSRLNPLEHTLYQSVVESLTLLSKYLKIRYFKACLETLFNNRVSNKRYENV